MDTTVTLELVFSEEMYDGLLELRNDPEKEGVFEVIQRALSFYRAVKLEQEAGVKFMFKRGGVRRELIIP